MHRKGSEFRMTCHVFVCRDFVCIRQMEISGGSLYAASKTIVTALKPEQPGKVRSDRYHVILRSDYETLCSSLRSRHEPHVPFAVCLCGGSTREHQLLQWRTGTPLLTL